MDSLEFARHALRLTGRRDEAAVLEVLAYAAECATPSITTTQVGNAAGLPRSKTAKAMDALVAAQLLERRKGSKAGGLRLTLRTLLPMSLTHSLLDTAYGVGRMRPPVQLEHLPDLVATTNSAWADEHTQARMNLVLAGCAVAYWTKLAPPSKPFVPGFTLSPEPAAVSFEDLPSMLPGEIRFMDENRVLFHLNYDGCRECGLYQPPDLTRSTRSVAATRRAISRDLTGVTKSSQLLYARPEKLAEDSAFFATIQELIEFWNQTMPLKAALGWKVYTSLRTLVCEEQIPPEKIKAAFKAARTDRFWKERPLYMLAQAHHIETLAQTGQKHDRLARNQEIVKTGEDFEGYEF